MNHILFYEAVAVFDLNAIISHCGVIGSKLNNTTDVKWKNRRQRFINCSDCSIFIREALLTVRLHGARFSVQAMLEKLIRLAVG
jgi:hypothetical protein